MPKAWIEWDGKAHGTFHYLQVTFSTALRVFLHAIKIHHCLQCDREANKTRCKVTISKQIHFLYKFRIKYEGEWLANVRVIILKSWDYGWFGVFSLHFFYLSGSVDVLCNKSEQQKSTYCIPCRIPAWPSWSPTVISLVEFKLSNLRKWKRHILSLFNLFIIHMIYALSLLSTIAKVYDRRGGPANWLSFPCR